MRGWRRGLRALKKASLETFSSSIVYCLHSLLLNLFCIHWRSQAISFEDKSVDLNEYIWGRLRDPCQSPCVSHTTRSTDFPRVCKTRVILKRKYKQIKYGSLGDRVYKLRRIRREYPNIDFQGEDSSRNICATDATNPEVGCPLPKFSSAG